MASSLNQTLGQTKRRKRAKAQMFSEINVTPFVDVMLVLLVIFMVTAPMMTVGVPVDLPKTKAAQMNDQTEPLIVSVDASGKSYLQETALEGDALVERLIAVSGHNPNAKIYVRGDQKINYGRIMEVMGIIAAAGFSKVSLIAEMPLSADKGKNLRIHPQPVLPASVPQAPNANITSFPQTTPQPYQVPPSLQPPGSVPQQGIVPSAPIPQYPVPPLPRAQTMNSAAHSENGPKVIRSQ